MFGSFGIFQTNVVRNWSTFSPRLETDRKTFTTSTEDKEYMKRENGVTTKTLILKVELDNCMDEKETPNLMIRLSC